MTTRKHRDFVRLSILLLISLSSALVTSCYWSSESAAGTVTLNLKSSGRTQVDPTVVQFARVYLYADNLNSRVNIGDGVPYAEATMSPSGGSLTVDHVPAGNGYQLLLTLGSKPDGATFVPGQYGTSPTFNVTAGHQTVVQLNTMQTLKSYLGTLTGLGYDPAFLGKNLVGLAIAGSTGVVTATPSAAYVGAGSAGPPSSYTSMSPGGASINSVITTSYNSGEIWLNTTNGIKQFTNAGAPSGAPLPAGGPTGSVLYSGSHGVPAVAATYAVYVLTDKGLGGVYYVTTGGGTWVSIDLSGTQNNQSVLGFALPPVTSSFGLFATKTGAFAIGPSLLTPGNNNLDYVSNNGAFFGMLNSGKKVHISALAIDQSGAKMAIATNVGLFSATVSGLTTLLGSGGGTLDLTSTANIVPGSGGHPFRSVIYTQNWVVGVSDSLMVIYNSVSSKIIPLDAVVLGSFTGMGIVYSTSSYIAVSGSEGLTFVPLN